MLNAEGCRQTTKRNEKGRKSMIGRMIKTAECYLEGPTMGNLTQSMLLSGYSESYAKTGCDKLSRANEFKAILSQRQEEIDQYKGVTREYVTKEMVKLLQRCIKAGDKPTTARTLENLGKNCGWFAEDNAQQGERKALDERQAVEGHRIARLLLLETIDGTRDSSGTHED